MRFDVVRREDSTTIEPHFCSKFGCYGTNPNHGYTLEEACDIIATSLETLAKSWRDKTHSDIQYYLNNTGNPDV